jgi:aarF domain-containing kinase
MLSLQVRSALLRGLRVRSSASQSSAILLPAVPLLSSLPLLSFITAHEYKAEARLLAPPILQKHITKNIVSTRATTTSKQSAGSVVARVKSLIKQYLRVISRSLYLITLATPLALTYPLSTLAPKQWNLETLWLRYAVWTVESSGAAVTKLFQWAGSRQDLFGLKFCRTFETLQDSTTPHSFSYTNKILKECYGADWSTRIAIDGGAVLGSGCIGQVYKGFVRKGPHAGSSVAVKILHPSITSAIDADIDILYAITKTLESLPLERSRRLKYLNLSGMVNEFGDLLRMQLDLRQEADNIRRFRENFSDDNKVMFPDLVDGFECNKDVLVMEYMEGLSLKQFCKKHEGNKPLLDATCDLGVTTFCKMMFLHNFVHGDLHPGNLKFTEEGKLIVLDMGIAKSFGKHDHDLLTGVLKSFVGCDGEEGAQLLLDDSISDGNVYTQEQVDGFRKVLGDMARKARDDVSFFDEIGNYVTQICEASSDYAVKMNQGFVSIALAVRVMEGVALQLNRECEIWRISNKYIVEGKVRSFMRGE